MKQGWIKDNWQFVTTLCSLAVATIVSCVGVMSFLYTLEQQRTDNLYKEANVKPMLALVHDISNHQSRISNNGIGPAEIMRVALSFDGFCVDSATLDATNWASMAAVMQARLGDFVFKPLLEEMRKRNPTSYAYSFVPHPGYVIRAAESVRLVGRNALVGSEDKSAPERIEGLRQSTDGYAAQISKVRIQVEYCSMTGKFCAKLSPTQDVRCN